jgi:putative pyruvate formate lyase activating enzyme
MFRETGGLSSFFRFCRLCPRSCGIDRFKNRGFCGEKANLKVAAILTHFGEEPPISGKNGSGTVFFTGCSLKCRYCQNFQISHMGLGKIMTPDEVVKEIEILYLNESIHNINLVTPDHFIPYTFEIINIMREKNILLPIIFNFSGYQKVKVIKWLSGYADIYLPDFKYSDKELGKFLSNCPDYSKVAIEAIYEMIKQKGFLDSFNNYKNGEKNEGKILTQKGVLVRHLILPGFIENSLNVLNILFVEFGKELPISLMSQFYPIACDKTPELNRRITEEEFKEVFDYAKSLGFQNLFIQYPEKSMNKPAFLPDFSKNEPFVLN